MYNTDVTCLLYYLVCKEVCYSSAIYLQIMNIQCIPIIFMTHWSISVILSSHIGNFAQVRVNFHRSWPTDRCNWHRLLNISHPTLHFILLLRPNSSNLPCLYSTFHLEYPLVLSRFCFKLWPESYNVYGDMKYWIHAYSVIA